MKTIPFMAALISVHFALAASQSDSPFRSIQETEVPSGISYQVQLPSVENPELFRGKRVAFLVSHGVEELEITFPYQYLKSRGAEIEILVPKWTPAGVTAVRFLKPTLWIQASATLDQAQDRIYDLIILTGGAWNAQVIRTDTDALSIVRKHFAAGKPVAAICAGSSVLINAGLTKDQKLTGSPAIAEDLKNAGSDYVNEPLVVSGHLATSRSPDDLPSFVLGIRSLLLPENSPHP